MHNMLPMYFMHACIGCRHDHSTDVSGKCINMIVMSSPFQT